MYPVLLQIGPITIYSFGVFMALAAFTAGWIVSLELKRRRYDPELASAMVIAAALGGLLGARLLFIFEDWQHFIRSPLDLVLSGAGFTWYGGFFGGALAVTWWVRKKGIPWLDAADISAPALAAAYGVGRLGCHVAGDGDWGTITTVPWSVAYTNAIIGWVDPVTGIPYPPEVHVHPTPIYEFLQSAMVFGVLWSVRARDWPSGAIFWLYLFLAGLMRFSVEFWRINPGLFFGLSEAQWISVVLILIGGAMLLVRREPVTRRAA